MTRRLKRHKAYQVTLEIKDDNFIRAPHERQRNWLLNRVVKELGDELEELDRVAGNLVAGGDPLEVGDREQAALSEQDIMEDWQIPIMRAMTALVCFPGARVLEVGFGRGVASAMIQDAGVGSHTIVECNPYVIEEMRRWKSQYPGREILFIEGRWQDVTKELECYDGIFFHTYPLNEEEYQEQVSQSVTFAAHFFDTAASHMNPGGAFTYLTNERDSLSRAHQRLLLRHFSSFAVSMISGLDIPESSRDAHWSNQMALIKAVK